MKEKLLPIAEFLAKADRWISKIEEMFIYLCLTTMIFMSFFQVAMRNLFSYGFVWIDDLLRHMVLWTGFIGASLATREGKHINIDVFTRLLRDKSLQVAKAITMFVSAFASALLLYASVDLIKREMSFAPDTLASLRLPVWAMELIFPITFSLISLRFFFHGLGYLLFPEKLEEEIK